MTTTEALPEPHEYVWNPDGTFNIGQERCLSSSTGPCHGWEIYPIYTDDQMRIYAARQCAAKDAEIERLKGLMGEYLDMTEPPDPNCSCHLSPPCNDCVENGGWRDAFATCRRAALKETK